MYSLDMRLRGMFVQQEQEKTVIIKQFDFDNMQFSSRKIRIYDDYKTPQLPVTLMSSRLQFQRKPRSSIRSSNYSKYM
ncbi:hypothetical protein SS50377_28062 [Spironucleus salmonicida]|uniref:Uncharacterized protein n=1 Tax=Spironucleus salmonicida TaxID=348837 RepID=V6LPG4_9EUKA|nr:hypothetical protein SS50377_28062 [Spironucleus salmonicida]|eukprot:EST42614.1 Hypothetical protein SS50377_17934 [Spironucleus salmonicida]